MTLINIHTVSQLSTANYVVRMLLSCIYHFFSFRYFYLTILFFQFLSLSRILVSFFYIFIIYNFQVFKFSCITLFLSVFRKWFIHLYSFILTNILLALLLTCLLLIRVAKAETNAHLFISVPRFHGVIRIGWRTTIKVKYWPSWRERAVGISFAGGLNSDHRSHSCELLIAVWLAGSLTPQIEPSIRSRKDGWLGGVCFTVYRLMSCREHKTP